METCSFEAGKSMLLSHRGVGRRQGERQEVIVESRQELLIKCLLDAWTYFMNQEEPVEES